MMPPPRARLWKLAVRQGGVNGRQLAVRQVHGAVDSLPPLFLVLAGLAGGELLEGGELAARRRAGYRRRDQSVV